MEFLKRHYEKLVLAVLLLSFIASMAYLVLIVQETGQITLKKLQLPTREPDFHTQAVKPDDPQFNLKKLFEEGTLWDASKPRKPGAEYYSDLVTIFGVVRCGHENCSKLIPSGYLGNKCPFCKKELAEPPKSTGPTLERGNFTAEDPDGCGIPHDVKEKYGLSKEDPHNVLDDLDNDGFSNLYEYKNKTVLNDPRSRPPLWQRLLVQKVESVVLPFMLMKVNTNNSEDQSKWDIQVNRTDTGKSTFTSLNDVLKIDGRDYRISKVKLDQVKKTVGGSEVVVDNSVITLEQVGGKTVIEMPVGKTVFSPDPKAFLLDTGNNAEITVGNGEEFSLGNRYTGVERYRVETINQKEGTLSLIDRTRGSRNFNKPVGEPVTLQGKIPQNERVRVRSGADAAVSPEGMMMR